MCGPHHRLGRGAFASGPEILRRLLQLRSNASILEQGCAGFSAGSANRCDQFTRHPWRTLPPLRPRLSFRYTQGTLLLTIARIASNLSQLTYPSWVLRFNVSHSFRVLRRIFTLTPSAVYPAATAVLP